MADECETGETEVGVFMSPTRSFVLPEDGSKDIIMVGLERESHLSELSHNRGKSINLKGEIGYSLRLDLKGRVPLRGRNGGMETQRGHYETRSCMV